MGWASGSELAEDVWEAVGKHLPKNRRQEIARRIVDLFERHDCDTLDEAQTLMKDAGLADD